MWKAVLNEYGWLFSGSCRCGGVYQEKYFKNQGATLWQLILVPSRGQYKLLKDKKMILVQPLGKMAAKFDELGISKP